MFNLSTNNPNDNRVNQYDGCHGMCVVLGDRGAEPQPERALRRLAVEPVLDVRLSWLALLAAWRRQANCSFCAFWIISKTLHERERSGG